MQNVINQPLRFMSEAKLKQQYDVYHYLYQYEEAAERNYNWDKSQEMLRERDKYGAELTRRKAQLPEVVSIGEGKL